MNALKNLFYLILLLLQFKGFLDPAVLIEGVLFRARYLGSTQLVCEGQPTKSTRMMQAEEAVSRIKVGTVNLFLSIAICMYITFPFKTEC